MVNHETNSRENSMHVLVIGAGTAGLGAAVRLSRHPGVKVTILEATARIGGRIRSGEPIDGQPIDLGASWMHETRNNALFDIALRRNWPMKYTDLVDRKFTEEGELTPEMGIEPILRDLDSRVAANFHDESTPVLAKNEPSLQSFLASQLKSMPLVSERQKNLALMMSRVNEHFMAIPLRKIPAGDAGIQNSQGRDVFMLGKGYQYVIDWLQDQINWDRTTLHLESPVLNVDAEPTAKTSTNRNFRYVVEFVNHAAGSKRETISVDYVLSTIPIGALKHSFKSIFGKELLRVDCGLEDVRETVQATDVAHLGKIVVRFAERFWDQKTNSFFVVHEKTGECLSFINPYGSDTLVILTGPPLTEKAESDPDNAIKLVEWAFPIIAESGASVSEVVAVQVSDWTQSPYFLGSYSARAIGQSYDDLVSGYLNNNSNVRFAGEHTILEGNGCVHGAYASGLREAAIILTRIRERQKHLGWCNLHARPSQ